MKIPDTTQFVLDKLHASGYEAYLVGGCIRDILLGLNPKDWDISTSATPSEIKEVFSDHRLVDTGYNYGTVAVLVNQELIEITTFRIDGAYTDGRRPDYVTYTRNLTEDLARRDFSINACAASDDVLIDPFGGQADIAHRLIRCVGDPNKRFEEDALRILRGIRFAAQLDFDLHPDTFDAMKNKSYLLSKISVERIQSEFDQIISAARCGRGINLCLDTEIFPYILGGNRADPIPGGNRADSITAAEKEKLRKLSDYIDSINDSKCRLALIYLCFDEDKAVNAIKSMPYDKKTESLLISTRRLFLQFINIDHIKDMKAFISQYGYETYEFLDSVSKHYHRAFGMKDRNLDFRTNAYHSILTNKEPVLLKDLAVNGSDLKEAGMEEGREIGRILHLLLDLVHQAPEKNEKTVLLKIAAENYRIR